MPRIRRPFLFICAALLCPSAHVARARAAAPDMAAPPLAAHSRTLTTRFTYTASVPVGAADRALPIDLWLPLPSDSSWQRVTDVVIAAAGPTSVGRESVYGNRMVYLHLDRPVYPVTMTVSFTVQRTEPRILAARRSPAPPAWAPITTADTLVPVGGQFQEIAHRLIGADTAPLAQERDLFGSVVSTMRYDYHKASPRYAMGDSAFVCNYGSGNCSDLHSYLISLSRSAGIPAVLEFGFPLTGVPVPSAIPLEGAVGGYHCWIWFKVAGQWTPEDAADARRWQDIGRADMRDYLFGNLLLPRSAVAMSRGRDIVLVPPQKGPPLNYLIYPYAESGGEPAAAQWSLVYRILKSY